MRPPDLQSVHLSPCWEELFGLLVATDSGVGSKLQPKSRPIQLFLQNQGQPTAALIP